jgi:hypothetical protein
MMHTPSRSADDVTDLKWQLITQASVTKITTPPTDVKIQVDQWAMPAFMAR